MGKKLVCGSKEYTVKDVTVREDKLRDLYKLYITINATDVTLSEIEALITNKADKEYYEDSTLVATYTGYYKNAEYWKRGELYTVTLDKATALELKVKELAGEIDYDTCTLEEYKAYRIKESKTKLAEYLADNTITSTCHGGNPGVYAITEEKQNLLTKEILLATMATTLGISYQPSWNESGKACTYDWTLLELQELSFEITSVVKPLVSKQQALESAINSCDSKDAVAAIEINYEA